MADRDSIDMDENEMSRSPLPFLLYLPFARHPSFLRSMDSSSTLLVAHEKSIVPGGGCIRCCGRQGT